MHFGIALYKIYKAPTFKWYYNYSRWVYFCLFLKGQLKKQLWKVLVLVENGQSWSKHDTPFIEQFDFNCHLTYPGLGKALLSETNG